MARRRASRKYPLDALVSNVWHVELAACKDYAEFMDGVRRMMENLDLTLATLGVLDFSDVRMRRAADQVKLSAVRLLDLCREVPEAIQGPEDWRQIMATIMANYEQFRAEAGRLYLLVVPAAAFNVLRLAL